MTAGRRKYISTKSQLNFGIGLCAFSPDVLLLLLLVITTLPTATTALNLFGKGSSSSDIAESDAPKSKNTHPDVPIYTPQQGQELNAFGDPTYGVDVSFPIHRTSISDNYAWLPHNIDPENNPTPKEYIGKPVQYLGNKQAEYNAFMDGCNEKYGDGKKGSYSACQATEDDRVEMSYRQPCSMQNYTDIGFKKIKAPPAVWDQIKTFWDANKDKKNWSPENWPRGNTYTNHWIAPTYMVSVEDGRLRGAGSNLKNRIWNAAQSTIEEWTGEELTKCSLYGIRVYTEGSILATHVDRMPLVSSAIINVDQDVDEPWPLEVYGHDGKAYNVTMEPGDMVLYESHSVLHGRPFPLKGRFFANIFVHFEPVGHSLRHNAKEAADRAAAGAQDNHVTGGHEQEESDGLPPYIIRGSLEEDRWRASHTNSNPGRKKKSSFTTGSTPAHAAAQAGDADELKNVIEKLGHLVDAKDVNGWTPLHEGARGGHIEVVKLLVDKGANINERTSGGQGGTPLYWSIEQNGEDHPVSEFLASLGAISIGPDL
jgi:prolyl 4-hydroxylase